MENLIIGNYKEPLRKVEKGFGYLGAISMTPDKERIQCHICGEVFVKVGQHIIMTHKISVREYKKTFQLQYGTALHSENERERRKAIGLEMRAKETKEEKEKRMAGLMKWIGEKHEHIRSTAVLEYHNKRGTCPDQLLSKLKKLADGLGRTPLKAEFESKYGNSLERLIFSTFGSWHKFLDKAGLKTSTKRPVHFTDEQLLDFLRNFYKTTGKIPARSDSQRGLIPSHGAYMNHFGGMIRARELAGIPQVPFVIQNPHLFIKPTH